MVAQWQPLALGGSPECVYHSQRPNLLFLLIFLTPPVRGWPPWGQRPHSLGLCSMGTKRIAIIILISGFRIHREAGSLGEARLPEPPGARNHSVHGQEPLCLWRAV